MDVNDTGKIDGFKIYTFLRDCDYIATNDELVSIIRRIDLDADEMISFEELKEFLPPSYA
jgi:Ca2+-binding EF-hand superfamily protein